MLFTNAQKVTKQLGYFCNKILLPRSSKNRPMVTLLSLYFADGRKSPILSHFNLKRNHRSIDLYKSCMNVLASNGLGFEAKILT